MRSFPVDIPQVSASLKQTEILAATLMGLLKPYDLIGLSGPLGAGKTTFVRAAVKALGGDADQVRSPSFTLINEYLDTRIPVFHFDLYRFADAAEFHAIGGDEYLDRGGLVFVEWPENGGGFLPEKRYTLTFAISSATERIITLSGAVA